MKRTIFLATGVIALALTATGVFGNYALCSDNKSCVDILHALFLLLLPVPPAFLFSLITYPMREEIYVSWFRFARWWTPISMVAIFLAPEYSNDWMFPIEKGTVAVFFMAVFCIVSIVIIARRYLRP